VNCSSFGSFSDLIVNGLIIIKTGSSCSIPAGCPAPVGCTATVGCPDAEGACSGIDCIGFVVGVPGGGFGAGSEGLFGTVPVLNDMEGTRFELV